MDKRQKEPGIFYRHFELPPSFPVIALLGPMWKAAYDPKGHLRFHFHNCLEIGYHYEGGCTLYTPDGSWHIQAPCVVVVPPNLPHITVADKGVGSGAGWFFTDPVLMQPGISPRLGRALSDYQRNLTFPNGIYPQAQYPELFALVEMLVHEMEQRKLHYERICRALFGALFMMFLRYTPEVPVVQHATNALLGMLAPAMTYIAENYMNNVSMDTLAQLCHVSTSHFRRLFKHLLGWAPLDYLQVVRVERACSLLFNSKLSVTEISMQVGYPSPSSFNRQFRRIYGISPGQWRQQMQSEENPQVSAYLRSVPSSNQQFFPPELFQV